MHIHARPYVIFIFNITWSTKEGHLNSDVTATKFDNVQKQSEIGEYTKKKTISHFILPCRDGTCE